MGVQISKILTKSELEFSDLSGKILAVDAFLWLHQFLSIIRQRDGTPLMDSKGRTTSHLSGILYRSAKLLERDVKLVWVFDGEKPDLKTMTIEERKERKEEALKKWKEALDLGDMAEARKAAQMSSSITGEMLEESKKLLGYMGIPVVQAPSEGEAQCAHMCRQGCVYSVASQDSDSLLFNSPRLIRNLSITGKRKIPGRNSYVEIKPEMIDLKILLKELGITREQLIIIGILVGSDYNPGIKGIGPKKALKLVKKEKTLENVLKKIEWDYETPAKSVFDFYMNPPVKDVELKFGQVDSDNILKFLVDEHDFSQERIEKVIKSITENKQKSLGSWLK